MHWKWACLQFFCSSWSSRMWPLFGMTKIIYLSYPTPEKRNSDVSVKIQLIFFFAQQFLLGPLLHSEMVSLCSKSILTQNYKSSCSNCTQSKKLVLWNFLIFDVYPTSNVLLVILTCTERKIYKNIMIFSCFLSMKQIYWFFILYSYCT